MLFFLMAHCDGMAIIAVEWVCRDYFRHLSKEKFLRKVPYRGKVQGRAMGMRVEPVGV
jgi:hypothetical protein